jgi:DNA helicase IV
MEILTKAAKNYIALHKLTCKMEMKKFLISGLKNTKHITAINHTLIYYSGIGFGVVANTKVDLCWIDWLEDEESHPKKFNIVKDKNFEAIYFSENLKKSIPYFELTPEQLKKKVERDKIQLEELRQRQEKRNREIIQKENLKKLEEKRIEDKRIQKENAIRVAKEADLKRIEDKRIQKENAIRVAKEADLKRIYEEQKREVFKALNKNLSTADKMMEYRPEQWCKSYKKIKLEWLRQVESHQWYGKTSQNNFSDAQLEAIGEMRQFCLLRARAGSGKTTVVKHKIDLLLTKAGIQPDEIMALAFNKSAATKINKELQSQFGHILFNNSRTFHSLAHGIVNPSKELLYDENSGTQAKQSQYIESLLQDEINPTVIEIIYDYFRREMVEVENLGSLLNKSQYFQMRRNCTHETLAGEKVKSRGEKWIADFLFEHDILYQYERPWGLGAKEKEGNYYPDFSIMVQRKGTDIILEHWGIDEFDESKSTPDHWKDGWQVYRANMLRKREYWADKKNPNTGFPIVFLETSIRDLKKGRVSFEDILRKKLVDCGVIVKKLPYEQLYENVVRRRVPSLAVMLGSFIQRAKQSGLSPDDVDQKVEKYKFSCEKEKIFVLLASRIYHRYQDKLGNRLDFNDLMREAVDTINAKQGLVSIRSGEQSNIKLDKLKWIIIDEYQDFSQLFMNLINALRSYNPNIKIFCVGDDWQAINAFAGSDLKFFTRFGDYFNNPSLLDLPDNYRSQKEVVTQSNKFMEDRSGMPSLAMRSDIEIQPLLNVHTCDCFINFNDDSKDFMKFKTFEEYGQKTNLDKSFQMARIFRTCWELIRKYPLRNTTFMILSRGDRLSYTYRDMYEFKRKLKTVFYISELKKFSDFDKQVSCSTVHKAKGLEADVVLILDVNERKFPIIHPNNQLLGILGVSMTAVYEEERRLFYVALTRARRMVYLLHEKNLKSEFVSDIDVDLNVLRRELPSEIPF